MSVPVRRRRILLITLAAILAIHQVLAAAPRSVAAALSYVITDLGTLGGAESTAFAINNIGQIVGNAQSADGSRHAFRWQGGIMARLGELPGFTGSSAFAINDAGQVAGTNSASGFSDTRAVRWTNDAPSDLGTLGRGPSFSHDINATGQIAGYSSTPAAPFHAFLADTNGMRDLGTPPGSLNTNAFGLNDAGQVVGIAYSGGITKPFLWQNGQMAMLPLPEGATQGLAYKINVEGSTVGSLTINGNAVAALWGGGGATTLGTLGGAMSFAQGLNAAGHIVGDARNAAGESRAFLFRDGAMVDLNSLLPADSGWVLTSAVDINDRGQIVGNGMHDGQKRAYLLTPPAPLFADVPTNYWAAAQIGQLAQRGITTGCDTRLFCPERNVTRAEMAVFIERTLGHTTPPTPTGQTFADVPPTYWAYAFIEQFATLGITTGCGTDDQGGRLFCPDRNVTRAEMAVFIDRAKGYTNPAPPATATFADVPTGYWAYAFVEQFVALKITTGCGTDDEGRRSYCPDRDVTRAEMAVFITRAYPVP